MAFFNAPNSSNRWHCGGTFFIFVLLLDPCALTATTAQHIQEPYHLPFDYDPFSPTGPPRWHEVNVTGNEWNKFVGQELIDLDIDGNECASIRRPSPINLVATGKCYDNHEILTRQIRDTDCKFNSLNFSITPHTLRAAFPLDDSECIRPTIDLPNGYPYRWHAHFVEIHLRAEHVLDGRRYDGELQINHLGQQDQKRKVSTVSVMLDASGWHDDPKLQQYIDEWQALADRIKNECEQRRLTEKGTKDLNNALSVGSDGRTRTANTMNSPKAKVPVHRSNKADSKANLNTMASPRRAVDDVEHRDGRNGKTNFHDRRHLQEEEEEDENGEEEVRGPRRKMFPYDIWPTIYFYRYQGQITYPPCSEIVVWRVLDEPLLISRRQFKQLARLITSYTDEDTCENASAASASGETYRPLEIINTERQELTHCTAEDFTFWQYPPNQQ